MSIHDEKYRQLGINISYYRKLKKITQQELADAIHMSRSHLSNIEAPNKVTYFSIATLFDIADALEIEPKQLFEFK